MNPAHTLTHNEVNPVHILKHKKMNEGYTFTNKMEPVHTPNTK